MDSFKAEIFQNFELLKDFARTNGLGMPKIKDLTKNQIRELAEIRKPSIAKADLTQFCKQLENEMGENYFRYILYPWSNICIKILKKEEFVELRTSRNLYKINLSELDTLAQKHIVVVGMSVGKAVAQVMCLERICSKITLVDFDKLETTNMNRIMTSLANVNEYKAVITAREIAEFDPYIDINIVLEAISSENLESIIKTSKETDLLIEVCDSLEMKVLIREYCQKARIPLIMDTSDKGMIDIERYDLHAQLPILHGLLNHINLKEMNYDSPSARIELLSAIVDFDKISPRAKLSLSEIGKTIRTWPQLGSSVFLGASTATFAARKILLREPMETGRYYIDLEQILST